MPEGTTPASGQAPAGTGSQGQAPQANNGGSPSTASQSPQAGGDNTQQSQSALTPAQYEAMIADLRKEAASHRTKATEFEKQLKTLNDAQLTTEQKRDNELSELQTKTLDQELRLQRLTLENAGYRLGGRLGIADIGAALALVQIEHEGEIEFDDKTHQPKNLEKLLQQVVKDHPALAAQPGQSQRPPASSGGATNPGAGTARTGVITRASYAAMSQQDRILRNKEVQEVLRQNGGRLPD